MDDGIDLVVGFLALTGIICLAAGAANMLGMIGP